MTRLYIGFALMLLSLVVVAASCRFASTLLPSAGPAPRPFNHAAHLERGIDCMTCHEGAERDAKAGMPAVDTCMICHEELDQDPKKPPEQKVAWFLDETGRPQWSWFTRQSEEIRFSHQAHAAAKVACLVCHEGIDKNTGLVPGMLQRMDSCVACHAATARGKNECSTCHTVIDRDRPPPNHLRMWDKLHGRCAREGSIRATANDCAMCHQPDACTLCHQTRMPADHHGAWRHHPHGFAARLDRARCGTCHASDYCVRCHHETAPRSHTAGWNAPASRHCFSCHLPLQTSGSCFVCHKTTPGHDLAPLMPGWHNPGMNCRSCHGTSLKHPDNGDRCTACHR
ncbi:MAG: cytochrome c3 family protein [Planctomycetes bacterium]|nr:cytochrome c3 family protein [Planctomycetota bacterium]